MSQSACLRWPNVGSRSYGWLLVGVGFITLNHCLANVYYPRYQRMYRIHRLDLLDQRWPLYVVRTIIGCLNTLAIMCWTNIGPMCVVRTIIGCLNMLATICWTNIGPICVVHTIIGCLNTLAVICWTNIGPMCVVSTIIIGYHLFDQPLGNVYILHYHNLLEYVSQKA